MKENITEAEDLEWWHRQHGTPFFRLVLLRRLLRSLFRK